MSRILGVWAVIAGLLFLNGAIGLGLFIPLLGREAGEMMTFFLGLTIIFGTARWFLAKQPEVSTSLAIRVSLMWMVLTLVLEAGLGQMALVFRSEWAPRYGMLDGAFWPLIVLCAGMAAFTWLRHPSAPIAAAN